MLGLARNFVHKTNVRLEFHPVLSTLRRLPFSVRGQVSQEFTLLEREGITERIDATQWVSPIVTVKTVLQKDGSVSNSAAK